MNWTKRILVAGFCGLALLAIGCGAGGSEGGTEVLPPPPPPTPPTLTALNIVPGTPMTLDEGDTIILTALGSFSDGSTAEVDVAWGSIASNIASPDVAHGTTATVTALSEGATFITATVGSFVRQLSVTVNSKIPTNPGPVYGTDSYGIIYRYPLDGVSARTQVADGASGGFVLDRAAGVFYGMRYGVLSRIDLLTYSSVELDTLPADESVYQGLELDSQGRVYAQGLNTGSIYRHDPVAGTTTLLGNCGGGNLDLALNPAGDLFFHPLMPGTTLVSRLNLATGALTPWANALPGTLSNINIGGGLAIHSKGVCYVIVNAATFSPYGMRSTVQACTDLNGDGDALDAGESRIHVALPDDHFSSGICTSGGGGILVNVDPDAASGEVGIWWIRDTNKNGVIGSGENTLYHPAYLYNGGDGGCVAASR